MTSQKSKIVTKNNKLDKISRADYMKEYRRKKIANDLAQEVEKSNSFNITPKFTLSKSRSDAVDNLPDDDTIDENQDENLDENQDPDETNDNDNIDESNEPDDIDYNTAMQSYTNSYKKLIDDDSAKLLIPDNIYSLMQEITDLQTELKQTRDLLDKTNKLVSILNDELVNKHDVITDLKKVVNNNTPITDVTNLDEFEQYFQTNKYKYIDPTEVLDEVHITPELLEILKKKML